MSEPKPVDHAAINRLLVRRGIVANELRDIDSQIDQHKVKCPTCRCRILPETACACCAEPAPEDYDV
jgi:hypothetical protein